MIYFTPGTVDVNRSPCKDTDARRSTNLSLQRLCSLGRVRPCLNCLELLEIQASSRAETSSNWLKNILQQNQDGKRKETREK